MHLRKLPTLLLQMILQLLRIIVKQLLRFLQTLIRQKIQAIFLHILIHRLLMQHYLKRFLSVIQILPDSQLILLAQSPFLDIFFLEKLVFFSCERLLIIFHFFSELSPVLEDFEVALVLDHVVAEELREGVVDDLGFFFDEGCPGLELHSDFFVAFFEVVAFSDLVVLRDFGADA